MNFALCTSSIPPGAIEAGAMLGSHRERNPSRSENWHRRTTRYTPPLSPFLHLFPAAPASREFRGIPRLVTGGGDRVRFAISPANTPRATRQPLSSPRTHRRHRRGPETFGGGIGGEYDVSSASNAEAPSLPPVMGGGEISLCGDALIIYNLSDYFGELILGK